MSKEREVVDYSLSRRLKRAGESRSRSSGGGSSSSGIMLAGNTSGSHGSSNMIATPCAACKLLRRRCAQECPFAPYFPPHEPHKFASVHKIYGASNVSKMLMEVPENQRADAANSLVYEANARIRDPVYGCMGVISALQQQGRSLQVELNAVKAEVMRYRPPNENIMRIASPPSSYNTNIINNNTDNPTLLADNINYTGTSTAPATSAASTDDGSIKAGRFWSH